MNKKAQLAMIDLMVAIGISLIMIAAIVISWNNITNEINSKRNLDDMQIKILQISDVLISSAGTPNSWEENSSNMQSLGFAYTDRILSANKLKNASNMDYGNISRLLQIQKYQIAVNITYLNNSNIYSIGNNSSPSKSIITLNRLAILRNETRENKNEIVKVKFTLWK